MLIAFAVSVILTLFSRHPFQIFTGDEAVILLGSQILWLSLLIEPGRSMSLVYSHSLKAAGDTKFPAVIGVIFMCVIGVPPAYLLGVYFGLGLLGIYLSFIFDEWVRSLIMLKRWRSRVWERMSLVKDEKNAGVSVSS